MEFLVGALVVLGFLAIVTRFIARDASGQIVLPRIVDDSIGMWALRRITGRRLGERPLEDDHPPAASFDANASEATRAALGAIAAANVASQPANAAPLSPPAAPIVAPPVARPRSPASGRRPATVVASPTPVGDLRRRQQAQQLRPQSRAAGRSRRVAAFAAAVVAVSIVGLALGAFIGRSSEGNVLSETSHPTASDLAVVAPSGTLSASAASSAPTASPTPATTPRPTVATITSLTKTTISGSTKLKLTLKWTLTDTGTGITSQLLQRRTDSGSWITVSLPSSTTRAASFTMSRGHTYTFRIRGTDKAGNVGSFASRLIRI